MHSKFSVFKLLLIILISGIFTTVWGQSRSVSLSPANSNTTLSSNSDYGFNIHYTVGELQLNSQNTRAGEYDLITIEGYGNSGRVGEPTLPVSTRIISVPLGAEPSFNILMEHKTNLSREEARISRRLIPAQESVSKSADINQIPFEIKEELYQRNTYVGGELFKIEEIGIMRGVRLFMISYEPLRYNPSNGSVEVCLEAEIRVDFNNPDLAATQAMLAKTASFEFEQLYSKTIFNWNPNRASLVSHPTKMLILCPPAYESTMAPFIEWKQKEGFIVNLVTVGSGATVANNTTAIKTYIQDIWDSATAQDPAPTYLIIVGDHGTSGNNITSNSGQAGSHITDLTYVRLNGTDYLPEMYHGRFSVSNTTELQNVINKSLMFARTSMPDISYLGKTVLIAGVDSNFAPTHGNGAINYATTHYFNAAHGITSNNYYYPESGSSDAQIVANAAEGRGYLNYTAHGSQTSWADPSFSASQMMNLTNTNKPFVAVGNCCITNEFDYSSPCFGEAVIRSNNAGAAYIGGINSTYWDEDFYWAVGYKTPQTAAHAYDPNKLGAYDAMFHAPNSVADWAQTTGETIFMGNMAVQASTSSRKNYYWEIYHLMGDPSLKPYFGVPTVNNATFPASIMMSLSSITVTAEPYSRVALSMDGTLYATGVVPAGGSLNLNFTPFTTVGTADLIITCSGKITREETIDVLPASGPYMTVDNNVYADSNNNQPDYNESGRFNTTFKNVGTNAASNVTATLSCSTTGITITDATETIASLAAGASVTRTNAFSFNIANNIVDGTIAEFTITMVGGGETWVHNFNLELNAPALNFGTYTISDPSGNNNGRLDPGESATLTMPLINNGGAASLSGNATLTCNTTGITINTGTASFSAIVAGGSQYLSFSLSVSASMSIGSIANLVFSATAGTYSANRTEPVSIGLILEDFEVGAFNSFPWIMSGNLPWTIDNGTQYEGVYSAKSGTITHNQTTSMSTTRILTAAGTLSFRYKVSSESGYDYLRFYIDGSEEGEWSGEVDWTEATYELAAGTRELTWTYSKDGSVSTENDCAWVDYIVFPASASPNSFYPPQNLIATPSNERITLYWSAPLTGTPSSYQIYRNSSLLNTVTGLSYQDDDVSNGNSYSYYVIAIYPGGTSDPSNTVEATPGVITEAVIGTGTDSTDTNTASPINVWYKSLHGQSVYTASELSVAGLCAGVTITQIGFNVTGLPERVMPNFIVRMKHTTANNVSSWISANSDNIVYSAATYQPTQTGWNLLTLSTPFLWNGTDNILVDTAFGLIESYSSTGTIQYTETTDGYRFGRSDSTDQTDLFTGGSLSTNRPNIKLIFQPAEEEQAIIAVNPTSLEFEDTILGESSELSIRISNSGNIALEGSITTPDGYTISQADSKQAEMDTRNILNLSINAGSYKDYAVEFSPTTNSDYTGNIVIASNAENNPNLNVAVSGTGYTLPEISVSSTSISTNVLIGEETTETFTITNSGGQELTYNISLASVRASQIPLLAKIDKSRSIEGSYLSIDPESYLSGSTMDLEVSVYNASTDTEWLKEVILTLPTGITINSVTDMTGGTDIMTHTTVGNTITWYGESSSGWGLIQGNQTGIATVNVSIPASQNGDLELAYTINGDDYNAEPHTISDVFILAHSEPPVPWLSLSSYSGSLAAGASDQITASFSAIGMNEGTYNAIISIDSNDAENPNLQIATSMEVLDESNHPPVINLPESFSFDKNRGLPVNVADYASDPDEDPLSLQIVGNTNVQYEINGLMVMLSATQNWVGNETLTFIVSDGELSASDQVQVCVLPVNEPEWDVVSYPNNPATIYATVSIEGYPAMANDQVAAFVDDECRGIADVVLSRDTAHATIIVQLANSNETVYFRVYSYSTDTIYDAMASVEPDFGEEIGTEMPVEIEAGLITSLPTPIVTLQQQGSNLQLNWNPVVHADSYEIYYCTTPNGDFQSIGTSGDPNYSLSPNQPRGFYKVKALKGIPAK